MAILHADTKRAYGTGDYVGHKPITKAEFDAVLEIARRHYNAAVASQARQPAPCHHGRNGVWCSECRYCVAVMLEANRKDRKRDHHQPITLAELNGMKAAALKDGNPLIRIPILRLRFGESSR